VAWEHPEALMRSDSSGPADGGGNLADGRPSKNPAAANGTINNIN
jgi:hypothetical protein